MFETITNQTSNNNSHETKKKQKVTIHLTGFGPFAGVKENPTTLIIETLKNENFALSSPITNNDYEINPIHYSIIETSMKAVQQYFEEMKCNSGGGDDDSKYPSIDIFIHFGVSGNSIMYELEERAKNEKTFRARDEQGEQPLNEPINEDLPIDSFLHCNLTTHLNSIIESVNLKLHENSLHPPLSQLVLESARYKLRRINMTGTLGGVKSTKNALSSNPNEDFIQKQLEELRTDLQESLSLITNAGAFCKASQDAGLFICNYCYYHSLQYSTCGDVSRNGLDYNNKKDEMQKKSQRKCYSLFVHVPPHDVIPVKVQVEFVKTLLQVIVESL